MPPLRRPDDDVKDIRDRIEAVDQEIAKSRELIDQHPDIVALEPKISRLRGLASDALQQGRHYSLEIAVAENDWNHESRRLNQYEEDIRTGQADVRAAFEAADEALGRFAQAPEDPAREALQQEWELVSGEAHDKLEAAIEADPGARQARRRCRRAGNRYHNLQNNSPRLQEAKQRWVASLEERWELEQQIWANNPGRAKAHQALLAKRDWLRQQQGRAQERLRERVRERLDQTGNEPERRPAQPPETEDQDAGLVSVG